MDTKSKNKWSLAAASLLFVCLVALSLLAAADILQRTDYLQEDHYYSTDNFEQELGQFADILKRYYVDLHDYPNWSDEEKIGAEEYARMKREYLDQTAVAVEETTQQFAPGIAQEVTGGTQEEVASLSRERDEQVQRVRQREEEAFQRQVKERVANMDQEYKHLRDSLALREGSFHYYIRNKANGDVYANVTSPPTAEELRKNYLYSIRFPGNQTGTRGQLQWINHDFVTNQLEGIIAVPRHAEGYSMVHSNAQYYMSIRERLFKECGLLVVMLAAAVGLFLHLRKHAGELSFVEGALTRFRRIPIDVRMLVLLFAIFCSLTLASVVSFFRLPIRPEQFVILGLEAIAVIYFALCLFEAAKMIQDKTLWQTQWEKSLFVKYRELLTDLFANRHLLFKLVLVGSLTIAFPVSAMVFLIAVSNHDEFLALVAVVYCLFYLVLVLPYTLRRISLINKIFRGVEEMAAGNLDHQIVAKGKGKGNLFRLANNLNNIKQGLKQSLEGQMKSERMKSELITNVSHDLKTPLTSIVNYVNLLKSDKLTPEERAQYIEILDRKTDRLKVLIDDLFEASKMASGAVELQLDNVNVASLLNQALAEFSDKIEASSLTFRVQVENPQMFARLDGKKTWRVMENLIVNALKYSMPNTRVFITLHEQDRYVIMSMRNVSAYEIDFDAEELFERFKRGDKSRHTEGSGLGLAIAKNIVELQGGRLSLEIDGDYFKVNVAFPK
ncbi:sensor histidine kinase [Brevibacillus composti]|uniref:histidine kinase n=1 Tax=Brevibacillus composti TaxID=2796470 RepID=A0A7T5EKM0_9BACL|nr:sensor histidine kinase [Brevibacillus composti]QQE74336.1 sensor histidine kinase [Brevibacillus composti]QUO41418.1 sensor histidine kinase [Brevibacillus composti]